jgi:hypothetical protein
MLLNHTLTRKLTIYRLNVINFKQSNGIKLIKEDPNLNCCNIYKGKKGNIIPVLN